MIFKNLLYLNLAPYLFNSVDSAYLFAFVWITLETYAEFGARFVFNKPLNLFQGKDILNLKFLEQYLQQHISSTSF